jgi:hypothetical protein
LLFRDVFFNAEGGGGMLLLLLVNVDEAFIEDDRWFFDKLLVVSLKVTVGGGLKWFATC